MKMVYVRQIWVLIILSVFLAGSCSASQTYIDVENSIGAATLARKEHKQKYSYDINLPVSEYSRKLMDIQNALNETWSKNSKDVQLGKYLLGLWNNELPSIPEESWNEINHPIIKTEIAQLLAQARKHCLISININELRYYVLKNLDSSSKRIKSAAVRALGNVGDSQDIPMLSEIVLSEEEGWAENAANSLGNLSSKEALEKLKELSALVKRKSLKKYIDNILADYGEGFKGFLPPACAL